MKKKKQEIRKYSLEKVFRYIIADYILENNIEKLMIKI
jgi:hypothetical protein